MTDPFADLDLGRDLLWGDLHKHMTGPGAPVDRMDEAVGYAREHLDVVTVLAYPFKWYRKGREGGVREETVGHDPDFDEWWAAVRRVAADRNEPGEFVTLPAYEWHGDRTRRGDHNVVFFEDPGPDAVRAAETKADLQKHVVERDALALPHHTGYAVGSRGADWDVFDPELSPVMEVFSGHGSSEGVGTPVPMDANTSMGPRTTGGTLRDALERGHRVGVVASNDGPGLPGNFGSGLAGIWATERTREGVREALCARRTYGVTGDRMRLWWELGGHPMGADVDASDVGERAAEVRVDCPRPLDRVELVHDGAVVATYAHRDGAREETGVSRVLVEMGWGPTADYGDFDATTVSWSGRLAVDGGRLTGVEPRFDGLGQRYERADGEVRFDLHTTRDEADDALLPEDAATGAVQGFVLEVRGEDAAVVLDLDDHERLSVPVEDLRGRARVVPFLEESWERLEREFDLSREAFENPDPAYHNARKVKFHPACDRSACAATVRFDDLPTGAGTDCYYPRAVQVNGQCAWGSPVWVA
ncbi:MAG: DUF3604 domain-containing protein [Halobacteriaceae archaeon]